jgi:hypothetical protein
METNILKRIFFDQHQHWEKFKSKYGRKIRPIVIKEVEKFRDCGNLKKNSNYLYVKPAMMFGKFPIVVKDFLIEINILSNF